MDAMFLLSLFKKLRFMTYFLEYFSVFVSNHYFKFKIPTLKMTKTLSI